MGGNRGVAETDSQKTDSNRWVLAQRDPLPKLRPLPTSFSQAFPPSLPPHPVRWGQGQPGAKEGRVWVDQPKSRKHPALQGACGEGGGTGGVGGGGRVPGNAG